jgi:hypothetical protein
MDNDRKRKLSEDEERKRDGGADTSGDSPAPAVAEDDVSSENKAQPGKVRRVSSSDASSNEPSTGNQQYIRSPKYKDVLLGRGRGLQNSNGNFLMRKITGNHRVRYGSIHRAERRAYAGKVLDEILATGARFLRRVDHGDTDTFDLWEEVQEMSILHDKVSHALREKSGTRDREMTTAASNRSANPTPVPQHQAFLWGQQGQGQHTLGGGGTLPPGLFMGSQAGGVHQMAPPLLGGGVPFHQNVMMTQPAMFPGAGAGFYPQYGNNIISSLLSSSGAAAGGADGTATMIPQVQNGVQASVQAGIQAGIQASIHQIMASLNNHGAPSIGTSNLQSPPLVFNGLQQQYVTTMGNPSAAAGAGGTAAQQQQPDAADVVQV